MFFFVCILSLFEITEICIWSFTRNYSIFHLTHVPLMDTFRRKHLQTSSEQKKRVRCYNNAYIFYPILYNYDMTCLERTLFEKGG